MKQNSFNGFLLLFAVCIFSISCSKEELNRDNTSGMSASKGQGHLQQTKTFSSDVVKRWLGVQTNMLNRPSGNPFGFNPSRYMAYCGVALYEAVVPGMPAYKSLYGQLTDMPQMPQTQPGYAYHWPTTAHAALSSMTKKFFSPVAAAYNAQAVTNLENELSSQYRNEVGDATFERSWAFGIQVADSIFRWAQQDNAMWPAGAYILPPYFPGMWLPEQGTTPAAPYWGYNRLIVPGSLNNVASPKLPFNASPGSVYFNQMNEVYTVSQNLTHEQKLIARYFNDVNPGMPAGAHYVSTVKQVLEQFNPALDKAALTYVRVGITMLDASTGSFKYKYEYLTERPIQFIRTHIAPSANPAWQSYLPTPAFPDQPSNHAIFSSSIVHVLNDMYGTNIPFSDATYNGVMVNLGNGLENLGIRHYNNFIEMEEEISMSRLYGGIHYRYSCDEGRQQGRKTAQNIKNAVQFLK
jgi:hypothetical protein